jgi:hypothetical protein
VPAVTLQAGEQWLGRTNTVSQLTFANPGPFVSDVYKAAAAQNVIVVGGHARTVGSSGGYLTGGGHSPFAHFYGLAVDSEFSSASATCSLGGDLTLAKICCRSNWSPLKVSTRPSTLMLIPNTSLP